MALEQCFQETEAQPRGKCEAFGGGGGDNDVATGGFDCNICLDTVNDPVVTLCGHLFCWPCIYKWLQFRAKDENNNVHRQNCPVCKAEVTEAALVPLYGRGANHTNTKQGCKSKAPSLGLVIPRRPNFCGLDSPRTPSPSLSPSPSPSPYRGYGASYLSSPRRSSASLLDGPGAGLYGEMVYARVFGNSITNLYTYPNSYDLAGIASPRVRRHVLQADRSLSRVCFFLFCCLVLCLLLF